MPAEYQAVIHGAFEFGASLLGPIILMKLQKRTAFILCGALVALSMATGKIYNQVCFLNNNCKTLFLRSWHI